MKIVKSRKYHVNLGNYEWIEFGGDVTLDTDNDELTHLGDVELVGLAGQILDMALEEEIKQAHFITDEEDSFVHLVVQDKPKKGKH